MLRTLLLGAAALAAGAPSAHAAIDIGNASVVETNADGVVASFTVKRSAGLLTGSATVAFSTADGSARAPGDYAAASGTLFFGSLPLGGEQTQQVHIAVKPDGIDEPSETFRVLLSGSAEIGDNEGAATIADDDPAPVVGISDAAAAPEGATATFTVSLNAPSGRDVSVTYATADGSAVAGRDYSTRSGTAVIPAGSTTAAVGVPLLHDGADEPDESFLLRIGSPAFATLGRATAVATIADDDAPPGAAPAPADGGPPASSPGAPAAPSGQSGSSSSAPGGRSPAPQLGLSSPRLRRPSIILVTVSCPRQVAGCRGRVTVFSRPNRRSKLKALRRERRLGQRNFTLAPGGTRTLTMALSRTDRVLLTRAGRMLVRAYAVTTDRAGRSGVRRTTGTLIARTSHS